MRLRAPSEIKSLQPRTAAPPRRSEDREDDSSRNAASPGVSCPTTHSRTGGSANGNGSLRHRVPRARFGYLLRGVHHQSSRRARRRSVHGLCPPRRSPRSQRCPSRSPCPPDVPGEPTPPRGNGVGRPPTGPCSRDESVLSPNSQRSPAVDAFLGFSPPERSLHPPGRSLVVTMPALSPLGGMTSVPTWTSGLLGSDGSAWSVSGLPALLGFCTFRPSRRSVHRPGERAHGFTSRRTPR